MELIFNTKEWLNYKLKSGHRKGFGIHSPYVFSLVNDTIYEKYQYYCYNEIEALRKEINDNHSELEFKHLKHRFIHSNTNALNSKIDQLIHRLTIHNKAKTIIEIGTGIGLTTIYLSKTSSSATIYTIEENKNLATIAQNNFKKTGSHNIQLLEDISHKNFDKIIAPKPQIDILLINSTLDNKKIIEYYNLAKNKARNGSIFLLKEPHKTKNIKDSWLKIIEDSDANITLDLYKIGIVIFKHKIPKQSYTIRF